MFFFKERLDGDIFDIFDQGHFIYIRYSAFADIAFMKYNEVNFFIAFNVVVDCIVSLD